MKSAADETLFTSSHCNEFAHLRVCNDDERQTKEAEAGASSCRHTQCPTSELVFNLPQLSLVQPANLPTLTLSLCFDISHHTHLRGIYFPHTMMFITVLMWFAACASAS